MQVWHIWVIVALVFFVAEIFTAGFAVACFSFGAIAAAVCALCKVPLIWQFVVFAAVSILSLVFIRPLIVKLFYRGKDEKTNADALIGKKARVSETLDPLNGKGRVAIDGDDWKAVSQDGQSIEKGEIVEVVSRDSIILTVKKA